MKKRSEFDRIDFIRVDTINISASPPVFLEMVEKALIANGVIDPELTENYHVESVEYLDNDAYHIIFMENY